MKIPALFANGKLVVGANHGDAFSKLTEQEQDGNISSGFVDQQSHKFISDEQEIYLKEIILIRHAHTGDYFDPGIGKCHWLLVLCCCPQMTPSHLLDTHHHLVEHA